MGFHKEVIIDCKGHLLGRLASVVAKELLNGQHITAVRCEDLNISGSLYRNKLKYQDFLRLRMNSNPRRGPFHYRAPSKIFWRVCRGMIRHKTARGQKALGRLRVFEGVPSNLEKRKKLVVPSALRLLRLKPGRDFCRVGDLSSKVGWGHDALLQRLEEKRKIRAKASFEKKKEEQKMLRKAKDFAATVLPKDGMALLKECGQA